MRRLWCWLRGVHEYELVDGGEDGDVVCADCGKRTRVPVVRLRF